MSALYIHIPFCQSRCIYCDFYSTTHTAAWQESYVRVLKQEMSARKGELDGTTLTTIYLGGGTPSQLQPSLLHEIFRAIAETFSLEHLKEVTIEANPDDVTPQWVEALHETPINRISMGLQSFNDEMLCLLRRRHTSQQALDAVTLCRKEGFSNLSLDLIYGLPRQTLTQWKEDVDTLLSLATPHVSAYALSIEEGTELWQMVERGEIVETDEELQGQMYEYLMDATARAGMEHYEISNFALLGYRSRHNSSYWQGTPYLGLGPGAHSYDGKCMRRANLPSLTKYVAAEGGEVPHEVEHLTPEECYNELVMTRLRTADGLKLSALNNTQRDYCLRQATPYLRTGQLTLSGDVLRLHRSGIFISNSIISQLFL